MPKVAHHLAVCALGPYGSDIAKKYLKAITERGGDITDCRIVRLGAALSLNFLVAGDWSALGRLESALPGLSQQLGLCVHFQRTQDSPSQPQLRPYHVDLVAPRRGNLTLQLIEFFRRQAVEVTEFTGQDYHASHTGAAMCNVQMLVLIDTSQRPAVLRDAFMDLCDEMNADGLLESIKT